MSSWLEAEAQTPALLLDRGSLVRNLREMSEVARANRVELFPHAKTHRMVEFGRLQLATGADGL
ncbi:MAG TPA: D-TA family PLP-dependent enzyme, partial [Propionibacteriaceae bacterium]